MSADKYINGESYPAALPVLLMKDVVYAQCGKSDVACFLEDDSVWIWGTDWYQGNGFCFYEKPTKVLENAALVTGGLKENHVEMRECVKAQSVWFSRN